jgi:S1-C subfamily serine protease
VRRALLVSAAFAAVWASMAGGCRRVEDPAPRATPIAGRVDDGAARPVAAVTSGTTVVVPDFARVSARVGPSVVGVISTVAERPRGKVVRGLGSGVIVATSGQVLTNEHVVAAASKVEVELATRERLAATVVHADPLLDLALLAVEGAPAGLEPAVFEERAPTPGEWVMAVGQPFGLGHTVTVGVISGLGRDHDDLGRPDGLRPEGIWSFIQTDASINVGNSGGPLVDADGEVVGITTAVRSDGQGLAFAIPSAMARRFLEEVWTHGRVRHARLGIKAENAVVENGAARSAVKITEVDEAGPAAHAGMQVGDVLLAIDDAPVLRVSDVAYLTQLRGVGARVTMTIKRADAAPEHVLVIPSDAK